MPRGTKGETDVDTVDVVTKGLVADEERRRATVRWHALLRLANLRATQIPDHDHYAAEHSGT